jgi:glucose/arabinose dehydrogenase
LKRDSWTVSLSLLLLLLSIALPACNLVGATAGEPPLPTIVLVTVTNTSSPVGQASPIVASPEVTPELQLTPAEAALQPTGDLASPEPIKEDRIDQSAGRATSPDDDTEIPISTSTTVVPPTATLVPVPTVVTVPPLDDLQLSLSRVGSGFTKPVYLAHAGDGSGRLFVVEQAGRILIVRDGVVNPAPFLDITSIVGSDALEQGLLSLAFHPGYTGNGLFYVNYTDRQGNTVIARYSVTDNPDEADPGSQKVLLTIEQPYANHNGGQIAFGPDGYLYIGMGDGGAANDPQNRAQSLGTLLGKILRIDVDNGDPYGVPQNNPFVGLDDVRPEIWSYGWRNPWRFSFDRATHDLYVADVGQNQFEEIHIERAGSAGQNYGWRLMEGSHCFNPSECDPVASGLELPVTEYDHSFGCSVTGGYLYRGSRFTALDGVYFYGDWCSGIVWGLRYEGDGQWSNEQLLETGLQISSFGQDEAGNVYLIDHNGEIYLVEA